MMEYKDKKVQSSWIYEDIRFIKVDGNVFIHADDVLAEIAKLNTILNRNHYE